MTSKKSQRKTIRWITKHQYLMLSAAIVLTAVVMYHQYIFGPYILSYRDLGYDTFHQYFPVYRYFAQLLRDGYVPEFVFSYGLGTSIFTSIAWIAEPFSLLNSILGAVFGLDCIGIILVYTQMLKLLCAGLLCRYYLKSHGYSEFASFIASYIFSFSGYMMTTGQHYFFAVYPIYFWLLIIFIDKALHNPRKGIWLTLVTMLVCLRGPYSGYMMLLASAFYAIVHSFSCADCKLKAFACKITYIGISMVFGLLLSMASFLPQAAQILSSSRLSDSVPMIDKIQASFAETSWSTIKTQLLRIFSSNLEGSVNTWVGQAFHWEIFTCFFSVLFVLLAAQYLFAAFKGKLRRRTIVWRLFEFCLFGFAIVNNFIPSMFNLFEYPAYRYTFVFLPAFAIICAESIDNLLYHQLFCRTLNYFLTFVGTVLILTLGYQIYKNEPSVLMPLLWTLGLFFAGGILLDVLFMARRIELQHPDHLTRILTHTLCAMLCCFIGLNLMLENCYTLYYGRLPATKEAALTENLDPSYRAAIAQVEAQEGDTFYRLESAYHPSGYPDAMFSLVTPVRNVSFYDTTVSSGVREFLEKICGSSVTSYSYYWNGDYNATRDTLMSDLLGLKYIITQDRLESADWTLIGQHDSSQLYQNNRLVSAGLLFDQFLTEEEADALDLISRQHALANSVILDCDPALLADYAQPAELMMSTNDNAILADGIVSFDVDIVGKTYQEDGTLTLTTQQNISDFQIFIPLHREMLNVAGREGFLLFQLDDSAYVSSALMRSNTTYSYLTLHQQPSESGILYFALIPQDATEVVLRINGASNSLTINNMRVSSLDTTYGLEGINLRNPDMAGTVSGTVEAPENCILYLPIPYAESWDASVDGQRVEIIKANYGFCAILMPAGTHSITLTHVNSTMHLGLSISIVTAIAYALFYSLCYTVWSRWSGRTRT